MDGKLYIVATPIGNLEDITYRAVKVLQDVDFIAAEDTRHTLKLLNHLEISKPLISYYKQNEAERSDELIDKLKQGKNIALVSDAGTPGISDPGEAVIKKAIEENIEVIPIPGACALVNALIASGLSTREFTFVGFLAVNKKEKEEKLQELLYEKRTLIFYEAPHKLIRTLESLHTVLGNRKAVLAKELTKIHETYVRGTLNQLLEKMKELQDIKGEFVIIVEGSEIDKKAKEIQELNEKTLEEHYKFYKKMGLCKKDIIKQIAKDRNLPKNDVYKYFC